MYIYSNNLLNKVFILLFLTCILLKQQESFYYLLLQRISKCLIFYLQYNNVTRKKIGFYYDFSSAIDITKQSSNLKNILKLIDLLDMIIYDRR